MLDSPQERESPVFSGTNAGLLTQQVVWIPFFKHCSLVSADVRITSTTIEFTRFFPHRTYAYVPGSRKNPIFQNIAHNDRRDGL